MRARPCARLPLLALLATLATGVAPLGGHAAPAVDKAPKAGTGTARDVTATSSVSATGGVTATAAEADDAQCTTARKRLFVDGEGWIVRRVTTCR
ncbi:hypothetical protein [Methylobacterium nonmethylotrophicum]|uniref:Uncharacterized protein n=1 Tax=Methylobacterium nonmethylotrophicum TaxID=1141884 RepID=A0A4Z0NIB8_9HYPH|nr:hypothetical protein [Methylobacterium nonmethylotrophicum]TGD96076.1 hypothetical protein EU555_25305 [Methylobacterium nonmethylotrophicum]